MASERRLVRRGGVGGELLLAVLPTLLTLATLFLVEAVRHERVLFASLASSAFLIYRDPGHPMNGVRVMMIAHIVGVDLGVVAALLFGAGYAAGAAAMVTTSVALVLLDTVHPPAIATALGFAFHEQQMGAIGIFLIALTMIAVLFVLQRSATFLVRWLARRDERRGATTPEGDGDALR